MKLPSHVRLAVLAAGLAASAATAGAADAARGRELYESRCTSCHSQSIHGREKREARDFEAIRGWVRRWSGSLGIPWTQEEIDDVSAHLNARYYRFPCPADVCRATGRGPGASLVASLR
jgi:mono/diheme cytochrome c family protein